MRLLLFLLSVTLAHAASITGKVVGVSDGDTITILTAEKQSVKVRLHGIDAPESKQAFGTRAKQELSTLVFGRVVSVEVVEKDRYGRTVGRVRIFDTPDVVSCDVNVEMVRRGFAWWYFEYARKAVDLSRAQEEAHKAKRGLWAEPNPIPPWEFPRNESTARATAKTTPAR